MHWTQILLTTHEKVFFCKIIKTPQKSAWIIPEITQIYRVDNNTSTIENTILLWEGEHEPSKSPSPSNLNTQS